MATTQMATMLARFLVQQAYNQALNHTGASFRKLKTLLARFTVPARSQSADQGVLRACMAHL